MTWETKVQLFLKKVVNKQWNHGKVNDKKKVTKKKNMEKSESRRNRIGGISKNQMAGLYDLEETIGEGHYAVVKLARHVFTGEKVAVKVN